MAAKQKKYWIKLYHEILSDPKMGLMSDRLWRRTIELFLLAGKEDNDGRLPEPPVMAWTFNMKLDDLNRDLEELGRIGIIACDGDGWQVCKFLERQKPSGNAARQAAWRARQREKKEKNQKKEKKNKEQNTYIHSETLRSPLLSQKSNVTSNVTSNAHIHNGLADELTEQPPGQEVSDMIQAIANVVKETYAIGVNADRFEAAAEAFIRDKRTPADVRNFIHWWARHKYYEGKPALKTLVQELSNAADVVPVSNKEWWE